MKFSKKIIAILIFSIVPCLGYSQEKMRVAVMPFSAGAGVSKPEASYLTERVRTGLIKTGKYDVISNDQINAMIKAKQSKQQVGAGACTSEKCIIDLGNALECEKMIVGSAAGAFGEFAISIKMLDVVKQKYELAEEIAIDSKKKFPNAARRIVKLLAEKGGNTVVEDDTPTPSGPISFTGIIWRSIVFPGWGHIYASQKRGYIYGGLFLGTGALLLMSHLDYKSKEDDYNSTLVDPLYNDDYDSTLVDPLYNDANDAYKQRDLFALIFLGTYVIILAEAILTGGRAVAASKVAMNNDSQDNFSVKIFMNSYSGKLGNYQSRRDDRLDLVFSSKF